MVRTTKTYSTTTSIIVVVPWENVERVNRHRIGGYRSLDISLVLSDEEDSFDKWCYVMNVIKQ